MRSTIILLDLAEDSLIDKAIYVSYYFNNDTSVAKNGGAYMGKKGEDTKKFIREKSAALFAQKGLKM